MNSNFELNWSVDGDSLVLWGAGELDIAARQIVLDAAAPAFVQGQTVKTLILDLNKVTFIDAAGLGAIAACANAAACSGTGFTIRHTRGQVAHLLDTMGFANLIVDKPVNTPANSSTPDNVSTSTLDGSRNPDRTAVGSSPRAGVWRHGRRRALRDGKPSWFRLH
jgi:anti-anti-sigma factor